MKEELLKLWKEYVEYNKTIYNYKMTDDKGFSTYINSPPTFENFMSWLERKE